LGLYQVLADSVSRHTSYLARVTPPAAFRDFAVRADWVILDAFLALVSEDDLPGECPLFETHRGLLRDLVPSLDEIKTARVDKCDGYEAFRASNSLMDHPNLTDDEADKEPALMYGALVRVLLRVRDGGLGLGSSVLTADAAFTASMTKSEPHILDLLTRLAVQRGEGATKSELTAVLTGSGTPLRDAMDALGLKPELAPDDPSGPSRSDSQSKLSDGVYRGKRSEVLDLTDVCDDTLNATTEFVSYSGRVGRAVLRTSQALPQNRLRWDMGRDFLLMRMGVCPPLPRACKACGREWRPHGRNPVHHMSSATGCRTGLNQSGHAHVKAGVVQGLRLVGVRCDPTEPALEQWSAFKRKSEGGSKDRLDIKTVNLSRDVFIDVCVSSKHRTKVNPARARLMGCLARQAEEIKVKAIKSKWEFQPEVFIPLAFDRFGGMTKRGYDFLRAVRPSSEEPVGTDPVALAMIKVPINQRKRFMWERIGMGVVKGTVEALHKMRHGVPIDAKKRGEADEATPGEAGVASSGT
jgi:hypothetical protein